MRVTEFLFEYDRSKTVGSLKSKVLNTLMTTDKPKLQFWVKLIPKIATTTDAGVQYDQDMLLNLIMDSTEHSDPTSNKIYTPWLTREYAKGNIKRLEDMDSRLTHLLKIHFQFKNKKNFPPALKDIMRLDAGTFETQMTAFEPPEEEMVNKGEAELAYNGESARVIIPKDEKASCYYGQGTKWCTAATKGNNMFDTYNDAGELYIIIPKTPEYNGEKYQLHFGHDQFMDEQDEPVDLIDILERRFPDLQEFFFKREPQIADYISFASDEDLVSVAKLIIDPIIDEIFMEMGEMETEDYGFQDWQAEGAHELGYVDDDGDIDWEKVHDDDRLSYGNYNDNYGTILSGIKELRNVSADDIRSIGRDKEMDGDGIPSMTDMEELIEGLLEETIGVDMTSKVSQFANSFAVRTANISPPATTLKKLGQAGKYVVYQLKKANYSKY